MAGWPRETFATLGPFLSDHHDHVDAIMGAAHAQPRFEAPPPQVTPLHLTAQLKTHSEYKRPLVEVFLPQK
jgi:hypothetical protein